MLVVHVTSQQLTCGVDMIRQRRVAQLFTATHAVRAERVHNVGYHAHRSMHTLLPYNTQSPDKPNAHRKRSWVTVLCEPSNHGTMVTGSVHVYE